MVADGCRPVVLEESVFPAQARRPVEDELRAGLESCGLAVDDTTLVLRRIASGATLSDLSREIAVGSFLSKRSARGREHVLTAIRRRFVGVQPPLLPVSDASAMLSVVRSPVAGAQLLLPYLLRSDRAACEIATEYVLSRLVPGSSLTKPEIQTALVDLLASQGKRWGEAMTQRWAEGILSVLRAVGALGRLRERETVQAYAVRSEVFSFHLFGLYASGLRGADLLESTFWKLLLLPRDQVRPALHLAAERGWWRYGVVGRVEEVSPAFSSVREWISHGLG